MNDGYRQRAIERFNTKYEVLDNGCWQWTKVGQQSKYGVFSLEGSAIVAHRAAYLLFKGNIRDGERISHTCGNPSCVNPEHLIAAGKKDEESEHVVDNSSNIVEDSLRERLEQLQESVENKMGDKLSMSKTIELLVDVVYSNLDMDTILLHYELFKENFKE